MALRALQGEFAVSAFDCIAAMKAARDIGRLSAAAGALFADLGLPSFAIARFFGRSGKPDVAVLDGEFHKEWSQRYLANRYVDVSQIAREMTVTAAPYSWDDVMLRPGVSEAQKRVRNEADSMGLENGLFTPVAWPDGSYVAVALAGRRRDLADPMVRTWAEILSSYYGCEARRFLARPAKPAVRLSPRQRECLTWVRHGKSSSMISGILGLSVQTVDDHIGEACRKLGVRTRTQAAVEATLSGLID
jgi:LuxR family quorum-sensing system transcriptional regulator CciR